MSRCLIRGLCVIALFSTHALSAAAQADDESATRVWLAGGLGAGAVSSDDGPALTAQAVLRTGAHLIRLRGSAVAEIFGDGAADLGILYGRGTFGPRSYASLSAGVSLVYFEGCDGLFGGPCRSETTIGLPIVAEATWRPASVFGLGLQAFGNLNSAGSFYGAALIIELGALR